MPTLPFNSAELLESPAAKRALSSGKTLPFVRIMLDTVKIMAGGLTGWMDEGFELTKGEAGR